MRRLLGISAVRIAIAALAAAAVVVTAVFVLARDEAEPDARAAREPRTIASVRIDVTPRVHAFGDRIVAEVIAVVDRQLVVPASIQIMPRFDPYELVAPVERDTAEIGRLLRIRHRYTLDCLSEECTPGETTPPVVEFPTGRVAYRYRGTAGRAGQPIRWPLVRVTSRVSAAELEVGRWRADPKIVPAASYTASPGVVAGILLASSIGLLLFAGAIAWRLLAPRLRVAEVVEVDTRPPLERASANGSIPERRKAVERVARELVGVGRRDLADRARTLAWSPAGPSPDAVEQLARDARAAHEGPS